MKSLRFLAREMYFNLVSSALPPSVFEYCTQSNKGKHIHIMFLFSVSMMAANEYEGLKDELDLEQSLRQKAETYAHEV